LKNNKCWMHCHTNFEVNMLLTIYNFSSEIIFVSKVIMTLNRDIKMKWGHILYTTNAQINIKFICQKSFWHQIFLWHLPLTNQPEKQSMLFTAHDSITVIGRIPFMHTRSLWPLLLAPDLKIKSNHLLPKINGHYTSRQCQKLGSHELRPSTDNPFAITLLPSLNNSTHVT